MTTNSPTSIKVIHGFSDSNCPTKGLSKMNFGYYAKDAGETLLLLNYGTVSRKITNDDGSEYEEPFMGTNNAAEYYSMIMLHDHVCRWAEENQMPLSNIKLFLYTDSRLMYNQVAGKWRVKNDNLRPLFVKMQALKKKLDYEINWIEREENNLANNLAADEVARDQFNKMDLKENIYRIQKHAAVKQSATSFPEYEFVRSYLFTGLPALRHELEEIVSDNLCEALDVQDCLTRFRTELSKIKERILLPQEEISRNSRRKIDNGVEKHKVAGQLASEAVLLLEPEHRAMFNGTFISLITSYRKAHQDVTPEALAALAKNSISLNPKDPQAWLKNLARLWNPLNAEYVKAAIERLQETITFFDELITNGDVEGLRSEVQYFFQNIFTDRLSGLEVLKAEDTAEGEAVTGSTEARDQGMSFEGTFETNSVY